MKSNLREAFDLWGLKTGEGSGELVSVLSRVVPQWNELLNFCSCIPTEHILLKKDGYQVCYLWPERWIVKSLESVSENKRFVPVGTLIDGSILSLDTQGKRSLSIGAFAFEKICSLPEERQFSVRCFRVFPFSYPDFLVYVHASPEDNRYLVG